MYPFKPPSLFAGSAQRSRPPISLFHFEARSVRSEIDALDPRSVWAAASRASRGATERGISMDLLFGPFGGT